MIDRINTYLGEIKNKEERLLKNMNHQSGLRVQNMGESFLCKWSKEVAEILGYKEDGYLGTAWQRSGATALVDGGAGVINLKCTGGWASTTVAEGYIAKSQQMKYLQVETLAGLAEKKQKTLRDEGDGKTGDAEVALENFADTNAVTPVSSAHSPSTAVSAAGSPGNPDWAVSGTVVINNFFGTK
eukprot:11778545-Ditylum_brightwellii.AAC.1